MKNILNNKMQNINQENREYSIYEILADMEIFINDNQNSIEIENELMELEHLKEKNPNSIKIATLLSKPSRRVINIDVDYIGFEIEDKFIIGFGLDDDQNRRNLPYVGYKE